MTPKHTGKYERETVLISKIDVWEEANARHRNISQDIDELADSIAAIGLQQPPLVQKDKDRYLLIVGQRRLEAVKSLGWKNIDVLVLKKKYDFQEAKVASVVENLHRKQMTSRDTADACKALLETFKGNEKKAARTLGLGLIKFRRLLALERMPDEIKEYVDDGKLSLYDAKRISIYFDNDKAAIDFANEIKDKPKGTRDKYFEALIENPGASTSTLKNKVKTMKSLIRVYFYLSESYHDLLLSASKEERKNKADVARDAVISWLRNNGYAR